MPKTRFTSHIIQVPYSIHSPTRIKALVLTPLAGDMGSLMSWNLSDHLDFPEHPTRHDRPGTLVGCFAGS